jgi:CheY-like chemotaxis protein
MKKLLIGAEPGSAPLVLYKILEEHYAYVVTSSFAEAQALIADGTDLVLCGLNFSDGRMFDLLRTVKANPDTRSIPFLCIKAVEGTLSPDIFQGIEIASKALGADEFIELSKWKIELGEEAAFTKLLKIIDRLV